VSLIFTGLDFRHGWGSSEESTGFLKKSSKKLLLIWTSAGGTGMA
jgi:hypothetical protein